MIEQLIATHGFNVGFQMSPLVLQQVQNGLGAFNEKRAEAGELLVDLRWRDFGPTDEAEGWMFVEVEK